MHAHADAEAHAEAVAEAVAAVPSTPTLAPMAMSSWMAADKKEGEDEDEDEDEEDEEGPPQLFAFLYASPLTQRGQDGSSEETAEEEEEVEGLDVIREAEDLKHMFEDKGQALSIRVEAATRESLRRTLQAKGVKCAAEVLHFTCHGLPDGFLALEDSAGQLDRLSASDLEAMLDRDRMPDVVFVSACFSHPIGDIFVQAGVKHVVAVRRDSRVADQVGRDFAKFFYDRLVTGDTVQDAFDYAQQCIQLTPGKDDAWRTRQEKKFLLLPKQGVDHAVPVFDPGRVGEVRDETPPPTINSCRRITSRAIGRKVITQRIVQVLAAQSLPSAQPRQAAPSRWLTICGAEGIGKTTCAIAACNFLSKRRHCKGVCYVPLVRDSGARGVLRGGSEARATLVEAFCTSGPRALCAADSEPTLFAGLNAVTSEYEAYPGNLIVLLDGCEQWAGRDRSAASWTALAGFIRDLLVACPHVAVLCTSRNAISSESSSAGASASSSFPSASVWNASAQGVAGSLADAALEESVLEVSELSAQHAAQLLLHLSPRSLTEVEVMDGVAGGHFAKLSSRQRLQVLASHRVVRECRGHPIVIGQVAENLHSQHLHDLSNFARGAARAFFGTDLTSPMRPAVPMAPSSSVRMQTPSAPSMQMHTPSASSMQVQTPSAAPSLLASRNMAVPKSALGRDGVHVGGFAGPSTSCLQARFGVPTASSSSFGSTQSSSFSTVSASSDEDWARSLVKTACARISVLVRPDDADAQWSAVLKSTEEILPEALYKYPSINRKFSERDLARLRAVYERIAGSGQGRAQKPVRDVVKAFAAWLEASTASLLSNSEYWNQGVIFGLVSKEQVNEILLSRSSGTFLIRISESVPGNLAVAYVVAAPCGTSRRVVHSLVVPGPDGGVSLEFRNGRKRFESLGAFLLAHDIFCHLWPDRNKKEVLQAVFSSMAVSSAATSFSASHGRLPSASAMNSPRSLASVS